MARRFEAQLKPCPYCGGKVKLKYEKKHTSFNTGTNHGNRRNVKFIRCERCHAHTIATNLIYKTHGIRAQFIAVN